MRKGEEGEWLPSYFIAVSSTAPHDTPVNTYIGKGEEGERLPSY